MKTQLMSLQLSKKEEINSPCHFYCNKKSDSSTAKYFDNK